MKPWIILIRERFPLGSYLPMVTVFTLANMMVGVHFFSIEKIPVHITVITWCLTLSFFFRLRLFDELKDVDVDKINNPTRPLARGVLSTVSVKWMIAVLIFTELIITALLGKSVFLIQALAIGYSLLMYKEFFAGSWLRPKLTMYAVTHTAVSIALGFAVISQSSGVDLRNYPKEIFLLGLVNWFLFNVFEFARKTFGTAEESQHADSYSKLYGRPGAYFLTASQSAAAIFLLFYVFGTGIFTWIQTGLFLIMTVIGIHYIVTDKAKLYRNTWGIYIVVFYVLLIAMIKKIEVLWS